LYLKAYQGIPEFLLPKMTVIPIGKGMAGVAAERQQPVQICNLQTDESGVARPSAKETKVEGSITVPMMLNGRLHGILGIAKPVPYEFTSEEEETLMEIGEAISRKIVILTKR
jgi:L-methionine (R)-S-oxide reductase